MMMNSMNITNTWYKKSADADQPIQQSLLFWLFLIFNILAVLFSMIVLHQLFTKHHLRQSLHNHAIMVILTFNLIYQLVDIPLHLQYFYTGLIRPVSSTMCLFWWFIDYGFFFLNLVLLMWSTFERHIIIFHSWLLATTLKRFFFHYFPICFIVIFILIFYAIAIFVPPCMNTFNFYIDVCGIGGCYGSITFFGMVERIVFAITPMFLIVVFSLALLLRVIRQKQRTQRKVDWRKQRKLTIHSILISSVYLCFDGPLTMITLIRLCGYRNVPHDVYMFFFYFSYFPILLLPMVCAFALPGLKIRIGRLKLRKTTRIGALDTLY